MKKKLLFLNLSKEEISEKMYFTLTNLGIVDWHRLSKRKKLNLPKRIRDFFGIHFANDLNDFIRKYDQYQNQQDLKSSKMELKSIPVPSISDET